jgi:hypothetical protein
MPSWVAPPGTWIGLVTVFVAGSICRTVPSSVFVTHSAPSAKAMDVAPRPTETVRMIGLGAGSIRHTTPFSGALTHTDPAPSAMSARKFAPTSMGLLGRLVLGLILTTEVKSSPTSHTSF